MKNYTCVFALQLFKTLIDENYFQDLPPTDLATLHLLPHNLAPTSMDCADNSIRMKGLKDNLTELTSCWDRLEGQVDDKQARLDQTLDYQQKYQDALVNISGWLDDIELRLFEGSLPNDTEKHIAENNVSKFSNLNKNKNVFIFIYTQKIQ